MTNMPSKLHANNSVGTLGLNYTLVTSSFWDSSNDDLSFIVRIS